MRTTYWKSPRAVRSARVAELLGIEKHKEAFGPKFLDDLSKRHDRLESRAIRLWTLNLAITVFLLLSLLKVDSNVTILGVSIAGSKNFREVLLVLSTVLGLVTSMNDWQLTAVKEIMQAIIAKLSDANATIRELFELRYGLSIPLNIHTFEPSLRWGIFQHVTISVWVLAYLLFTIMLFGAAAAIHIITIYEVYRHPNYSSLASAYVITAVVIGDVLSFSLLILTRAYQPFHSSADSQKLPKPDEAAAREGGAEMAADYRNGFLRRLFGKWPRRGGAAGGTGRNPGGDI